MRHHPLLMRTGRYGCWCECSCGWPSGLYKRVFGAHLAFGRHLLAASSSGEHREAEDGR